jgi:ABC-type Zn uptake system ZnuABC Zn-binding protein ZnuA
MRKIVFLLMAFLTCFTGFSQDKINIVATASMIADMAQNIAGDEAIVKSIVPIGGDPHTFDPTPSAAILASKADLAFVNGLTFEGWLQELIENSGTKAKVITVTDGIDPIASETYENATDPHAWMSAKLGLQYILNIKNALSAFAPQHAAKFEANYEIYKQKLIELDQYIEQQIQSIPEEKRILITSHDAFQYYGRRYNIQLESILGVSTDADAQTSDIKHLNEVIRNTKVPAVFVESTINPKHLKQIAKDNNIVIGGKLYSDSLGDSKSPASTYLDMLRNNTDVIVKALSQSRQVQDEKTNDKSSNRPPWMNWVGGVLILALISLIFLRRRRSLSE